MRKMHLVSLNHSGPLPASWRHPETVGEYLDPQTWDHVARTLEDAKFDAIFFADAQTFYNPEMTRSGGDIYLLDPVPLAMSVARATQRLGIGITISSSLFEPYGVARSLGTLDVMSGGRMAWNVVTSVADQEAQRFGMPALLPKDQRYDRADEMVEACMALWGSFPIDAYVADKAAGLFIDPDRLHALTYEGRYVRTQGPLTVPPSLQGRPVIMQAGSSGRGREFAARWAEILFTFQYSHQSMGLFYNDMHKRLAAAGRPAEACAILPAFQPIIGETEAIAREKRDYLNSLLDDDVAIARTSMSVGYDLTALSPDCRIADLDGTHGSAGALDMLKAATGGGNISILEAARRYAVNALCPQVVGTAEQVAAWMEHTFGQGICDGFVITPSTMPASIEAFCRSVVPILQERGLFRADYTGTTLRSHLQEP
jgi:FMN-dependent oxidoreductase (nitrilotriacetate monooxygenase family)